MLLRRITHFILQGRLQAMAIAFLCAYIPLLNTVSILIAALVTLRKGAINGLFVTLAAILPVILGYAIQPTNAALPMLSLMASSTLLTWLLAVLLRTYHNWSLVFDTTLIIGILTITGIHFCFPNVQEWWATQLMTYFSESVIIANKPNITPDLMVGMVNVAKRYATGFVAVSILLNAILQLVLARWWQAVVFNPGGLRKELHQVRLSHIVAFLFVIEIVLSYLGVATAVDTMPVVYGVFCAAGLSLLHSVLNITKKAWLWLGFVYIALIWLFPISVIIVAFLALLDALFDFRKRFVSR